MQRFFNVFNLKPYFPYWSHVIEYVYVRGILTQLVLARKMSYRKIIPNLFE